MVLIFLTLILEDFPDSSGDVEVWDSWQTSQVDLIFSEIALAQIDEKIQKDKLWLLLATDSVVVGLNAVSQTSTFILGGLLNIYLAENLLDFHEEVDGVWFVGEVAIEDGLDDPVAIIAHELVKEGKTRQKQTTIRDVQNCSLEVVQNGKDQLTFPHQMSYFVSFFAFLTSNKQSQDAHQPSQCEIDLSCTVLWQFLKCVLQKFGHFPVEQKLFEVDLA